MSYFEAILLGIVEGLTEFFPVSSTGHIIVAQRLLGIHEPSLFFNTFIQLGAILAVLWYYRAKLLETAKTLFLLPSKNYLVQLSIASIPVLVVGALLRSYIAQMHQSVTIVAVSTFLVAMLMVLMQRRYSKTLDKGKPHREQTMKDFFIIGLFQIASLVPGVSRSGITILGGISRKFSFHDAMDTAFLLALPAMGAATAYEGLKAIQLNDGSFEAVLPQSIVGFLVAFVTALLTIHWSLPIFRKHGFMPFVIYRILLSVLLFVFFVL